MSHATRWILSGIALLVLGMVLGAVGAAGESVGMVALGVLLAIAGLFAAQVGVVALAVKIGTFELLTETKMLNRWLAQGRPRESVDQNSGIAGTSR